MIFDQLPRELFHVLIVFARIGSFVMVLPGFSEAYVPARIRLVLALLLTVLVVPTVPGLPEAVPTTPLGLVMVTIPELLIGIALGLLIRLAFLALQASGAMISIQSGLAFAQNFDPGQGMQSAIVGTFFSVLGVALVFMANIHHDMIMGIRGTYVLLPVAAPLPIADLTQGVLGFVTEFFKLAFQMASPFIVVGLVFYIGVGLLNKLMPQVQVFFIAVPANILLGFAVLLLLMGTIMLTFLDRLQAHILRLLS